MNIIVAGCGKIGSAIVSSLLSEGHRVTVMDTVPGKIENLVNSCDIIGIKGSASDSDALINANAQNADLFIATTGSDEINMLACFFARKLGAKHTVARIRDTDYNDSSLSFIRKQLHISMAINPELSAAKEIYNLLQLPSAIQIETFSTRNIEMIELKLKQESLLDGLRLSAMRERYKGIYLVGVVRRGEQVYIPDGSFELKSGDRIGLIGSPLEIQLLLKKLKLSKKQAKDVVIYGSSRTAYYLAKRLAPVLATVKVMDDNSNHVQEFEAVLGNNCTVLCSAGAPQETLKEEGIKSMDAFVSLTGMDEQNILLSVFAASQGVPTVITKVNRPDLASLAEGMGLEAVITPSAIVSNMVLRYTRALAASESSRMETLYRLMDGKAEALEFTVSPDFPALNVPLKKMALKSDILIAGIVRDKNVIIPGGNDVLLADDRVIVINCRKPLDDLADIIKGQESGFKLQTDSLGVFKKKASSRFHGK